MPEDDRLVEDYLRRLRRAARGLPRARRRELLDEIAGHIAEARAAGQGSPPGADAGRVRAVLARLGAPGDIAREAGGPVLASRPGTLEIAAVILLLIGGFLFLVGWVVGCVLLWVSSRWRWTDKLLGTLVWPGGLFLVWYVGGIPAGSEVCGGGTGIPATCTSAGLPQWAGIAILVLLLAGPLAVAAWLLRRARRLPGQGASESSLTRVP